MATTTRPLRTVILVLVVAVGLVSGACADLTMDEALDIYEGFRPNADPCIGAPLSDECAATQVQGEVEREEKARDLMEPVPQLIKDQKFEDAEEKVDQAVDLRPEDPDYRRWRAALDIAAGREPSVADVLVAGQGIDPDLALAELAHYYATLWLAVDRAARSEGDTASNLEIISNLKDATCELVAALHEPGKHIATARGFKLLFEKRGYEIGEQVMHGAFDVCGFWPKP